MAFVELDRSTDQPNHGRAFAHGPAVYARSASTTPRSWTSSSPPRRCFFSKTLDALGVQPDASYHELDAALRDALTVGRPIES